MGRRKRTAVPSPLSRLEQRFSSWRKTRKKGERIPIALWKAAARAAVDHGLNRTASILKLDYDSLRKHVGEQGASGSAAFIELSAAPMTVASECLIELEDGVGARMRVHLKGDDVPDVVSLVHSFWDRD